MDVLMMKMPRFALLRYETTSDLKNIDIFCILYVIAIEKKTSLVTTSFITTI